MNTRFLASISAVAAGASVWYAYGSGKSALDNVLSTSAHPVLSSQRTIFIGDLHSDYKQTLATFRLAGLIGAQSTDWTGGNTTFVQTGDCVDRGDETKEIYDLLEKLREQASQAGGKVITLLGNHEVMQAMGYWSYVWQNDVKSFGGVEARKQAMGLNGEIGQRWLKHYDVTAKVPVAPADAASSDAYISAVHGGITHKFTQHPFSPYPDRINSIGKSLLRKLMEKMDTMQPQFQIPFKWSWPAGFTHQERELWRSEKPPHQDGPFWYRGYAEDSEEKACQEAQRVLKSIGCRRMVMGHTPQPSIKSRCDNTVFIVDTGISSAYRGPISALEVLYELRDVPEKPSVKLEREKITALYLNKQEVLLDEVKEVPAAPPSKL